MKNRNHTAIGRIIRTAVTLLFLGWLLWQVDYAALGRAFAVAWWPGVALALLVAALAYPLLGLRLHGLLRATGLPVAHGTAQALTWIGQFFNSFLPGATGGDIARLFYLWKGNEGRRSAAVMALVADRLVGMIILMAAGAAALFAIGPGELPATGTAFAPLIGIGAALAGIAVLRLSGRIDPDGILGRRIDSLFGSGSAVSVRDSGLMFRDRWRIVAGAAVLTVLAWALEFTAGWIVAQSLGIGISWPAMAAGMALAYAVAAIPVSLGGHGVREATLVFALSASMGVQSSAADARGELIGLALLLLAINVACSAAGGIVHLVWKRPAPDQSRGAAPTKTSRS